MLINDSHYLLDEVLEKLPEIKKIETEMENRDEWLRQDEVSITLVFFFKLY